MTSDNPDYNKERHRYYGLRKGDIVKSTIHGFNEAEIVGYGFMDNNKVYVKEPNSTEEFEVVAEWCQVVTKVEDRLNKA